MITASSFRIDFPAFADTTAYTDATINFWIATGSHLINQNLFGVPPTTITNPPTSTYDIMMELFVAHNIIIERMILANPNAGAGTAFGIVQSKSVDTLSISYDTKIGLDEKAGAYNLTLYGRRFWQLMQIYAKGPIHISGTWSPY